MPRRPRRRLFGCRCTSASYTAATICSSSNTRSACSIQSSRRSLTSPAIKPSPKLSCLRRISITRLPPALCGSPFRPQQLMIELANRLDRLLELLVVGQPATHLGNALAPHAQLPHASAPVAHGENMHLVAFAARAFRAAALVPNRALQQRAAQKLASNRQLRNKLLARLQGSISNHS